MNCPEELKRAYAAIKEVREALLELEHKLGEADAKIVVGVDYGYGSGYAVTGRQTPDGRIEVIDEGFVSDTREELIKLIYGHSNSRYENKSPVEIWLSNYEEVEQFADSIMALHVAAMWDVLDAQREVLRKQGDIDMEMI